MFSCIAVDVNIKSVLALPVASLGDQCFGCIQRKALHAEQHALLSHKDQGFMSYASKDDVNSEFTAKEPPLALFFSFLLGLHSLWRFLLSCVRLFSSIFLVIHFYNCFSFLFRSSIPLLLRFLPFSLSDQEAIIPFTFFKIPYHETNDMIGSFTNGISSD